MNKNLVHIYNSILFGTQSNLNIKSTLLGTITVLVALTSGCGDEFDPLSLINKPRILGVKADKIWLQPGDSTSLEALVVVPEGNTTYKWTGCLITDGSLGGYNCLESPYTLDLGENNPAILTNFLSTEDFSGLCDQLSELEDNTFGALPSCDPGLTFTVRLDVEVNFDNGDSTTLAAVKEVYLTADSVSNSNNNPSIVDLAANGQILEPTETYTLPRSESVDLELKLTADSREIFLDAGEENKEVILVSWYSTAGEFESSRTLIEDETDEGISPNTLKSLKESPTETLDLYVVVRDGRGGTDWIQRTFRLE